VLKLCLCFAQNVLVLPKKSKIGSHYDPASDLLSKSSHYISFHGESTAKNQNDQIGMTKIKTKSTEEIRTTKLNGKKQTTKIQQP